MRAGYIKAVLIAWLILFGVVIWQRWEISGLNDANKSLTKQRDEQIAITADYEKRINSLHELDTKHTTELTNAKAEIDQLRIDVINGTKRLRVKAECPKPEANTSESGSNESSARLSEAVEQDYWRLREMIVENEKQTLYLQNYINTECLAN
ncbi:lysis protein [Providencia rettgeri]|uniref:Lysis protein n=1 Tax=Providencia rettgeri TaxID=587 RepID=A0AB35L967_PRORE|nr:lysis protein [Providencia rettgeri]MDH2304997.1 lysis protein [Providencia rettgeri]